MFPVLGYGLGLPARDELLHGLPQVHTLNRGHSGQVAVHCLAQSVPVQLGGRPRVGINYGRQGQPLSGCLVVRFQRLKRNQGVGSLFRCEGSGLQAGGQFPHQLIGGGLRF